MDLFEFLKSQFAPSAEAAGGAGRFSAPDLMPAPAGPSGGFSPLEATKDNALTNWLRGMLAGKPDPMGDPEGARLAASMPAAPSAPAAAPPSHVALGSMPAPMGNQADALSMFAQGEQQPAAGKMPVPPRAPMPAFETKVTPAAPAKPADNGFDWGKFLLQTLQGGMAGAALAHGTPRGGGLGAFGAGFTTAQQQADKRALAENASKKQAFDQTMALRKDTRDERGANRSDEELGIKRGDAARRDKELGIKQQDQARKAEETKVRNQVAVEKLMKVREDGSVPLAAKMKIQDQLNQYADKVNKNGLMDQPTLDAALTKERNRLEQYYGLQGSAASSDPNEGKIAVNPSTGQRLMRKGGQWVPAP